MDRIAACLSLLGGEAHVLSVADINRHGQLRLQEAFRINPDQAKATAVVLADWGASEDLICAALLRPLVAEQFLTVGAVERLMGHTIAWLVDEYRALRTPQAPSSHRGPRHLQSLAELFVAAYRDPRLAILAAADYWSQSLPVTRIATGGDPGATVYARRVLVPLLGMLGMWELRKRLEALLTGQPSGSASHGVQDKSDQQERVFLPVCQEIEQVMAAHLPDAVLTRRRPSAVQRDRRSDSTDSLSFDLLVSDEAGCYQALYLIHKTWRPAEGAIHDNIGASKINGYRCLRTAIIISRGASTFRVSFHIRTAEMDEINNWGVAAICMRGRLTTQLPNAWWSQRLDVYPKLCAAAPGSLPETLCVFSPHGQMFEFQRGCTVVDFAYQVHSELANQCVRFHINGESVNPTTVLHHLDIVELEQEIGAPGPTRVWLGAAHTSRARFHIERFLKRRESISDAGRRVLEQRQQTLEMHYGFSLPTYRVEQTLNRAARFANPPSVEGLLEAIASGGISPDRLLHPLFADEIARQVELPEHLQLFPRQIKIGQCCRPRLGEDIFGKLRYRADQLAGITVHKCGCKEATEDEGAMSLHWRLRPQLTTFAELEIVAVDTPGLLGSCLQVVYDRLPDVTLHAVNATTNRGTAHISVTVEGAGKDSIDQICRKFQTLPNQRIETVRRLKPSYYVQERLNRSNAPLLHNPYSRLPVREREMLFGRSEELATILDSIHGQSNIVYVCGRKRVGKTSLLWHLRDYYLDPDQFVPCYLDFQLFGSLSRGMVLYDIADAVFRNLQKGGRLAEISPPLRNLFEQSPAEQVVGYLQYIQSHCAPRRLVLLIDEFSVIMDGYDAGLLGEDFFFQWRGILQSTSADVAYVVVVQQNSFEAAQRRQQTLEADPSWQVLELGNSLLLRPLTDANVRSLVERPTRNYLTFDPEALDRVVLLTGSSPFIVQAFCYALVQHMADQPHPVVTLSDVAAVADRFMGFDESLFGHVLVGAGRHAPVVCTSMAGIAANGSGSVSLDQLLATLPGQTEVDIRRTLQILCEQGILIETSPMIWRFASLLFQTWIRRNFPGS